MNPWTALVIGLVLGWLIEFAIDWFYWRRKSTSEQEYEELQTRLAAAEDRVEELESGDILTDDAVGLEPSEYDFESGEVVDEYSFDEEMTAAGLTAAVIAGTGDDTAAEESEKAPADELDEEIAAAFANQAEGDLTDEQMGTEVVSEDEEFDSAGEFAAAGLTAAAIADEGDDLPLDETVMTLSDVPDEGQLLAAELDSAEEFDSAEDFGPAEEIAATGFAEEVENAFEDTTPGEMVTESAQGFDEEAETKEMETFAEQSEDILSEEQLAAEFDSAEQEFEAAEEIAAFEDEPGFMNEDEGEMPAGDEDLSETAAFMDEGDSEQ